MEMTDSGWFNFDTGEVDNGPQEQTATAYRPYLPVAAPRNLLALLVENMNYGAREAFIYVFEKMGAASNE